MTIESVRTRAGTGEVLLTLSVPLESAALISGFLPKIGEQVAVAFADPKTGEVTSAKKQERGGPTPLTQSAVLLCKDPTFQKFVVEKRGHSSELPSENGAADYIRDWCRVTSRSELDTADGAKERFGDLMAKYREWQRKRERRK